MFYPARSQILRNVNYHKNQLKFNYHYKLSKNRYRPYYGLDTRQIIAIAQRTQEPINPIYSLYQRRLQAKQIKPYFDIDTEQFQQIVNRLNIQTRLSKKQLNEQEKNGYKKLKVFLHYY